jgi:hypothetical protein
LGGYRNFTHRNEIVNIGFRISRIMFDNPQDLFYDFSILPPILTTSRRRWNAAR